MPHEDATLQRTFDLLSRGYPVHWMAKSPTGYAAVGGPADSAESLVRNAARQDGWDFYVSLNPAVNCFKTKPAKADITALQCIGIDIDPHKSGDPLDLGSIGHLVTSTLQHLTGIVNCHTLVNSGRGMWAWLYVEAHDVPTDTDREAADLVVKGFTDAFADLTGKQLSKFGHVDPACAELSRIARCPGTINTRASAMATIVVDFFPIEPIRYSRIQEIAEPFVKRRESESKPAPVTGSSLQDIAPSMNLTSRQFAMNGVDKDVESRHRRCYSAAKNLFELGVPPDLAEFILWSGAERCRPSLNKEDPTFVKKTVAQVWKIPRNQ